MDNLDKSFINPAAFSKDATLEATRTGFGRGLKKAGEADERVVALSADLAESTQASVFAEAFPTRFIEVGIAEQNMAVLAAGLAAAGKIPFATSFAAFNPGRNWEQIKTTACINDRPVKIVGSHAGLTDGPDGATHQMLEDIAIMRVLPKMVVIAPGDSLEAERATQAIAKDDRPTYLRLGREKTAIFSRDDAPFEIGKAYVLRTGDDVTICATGTMTYNCLEAAIELEKQGVSAEMVHIPTIKPLDDETILSSVRKTGRVVSVEEAQDRGGLGGAIAEVLGEKLPTPLKRIGMQQRFGESGDYGQLVEAFGLDAKGITKTVKEFVASVPKYHQGF